MTTTDAVATLRCLHIGYVGLYRWERLALMNSTSLSTPPSVSPDAGETDHPGHPGRGGLPPTPPPSVPSPDLTQGQMLFHQLKVGKLPEVMQHRLLQPRCRVTVVSSTKGPGLGSPRTVVVPIMLALVSRCFLPRHGTTELTTAGNPD